VFDASDDVRTEIFNWKRNAFWRNLVAEASRVGAIAPEVDVELLFRALDRNFESAMLEWVVGELAAEHLAPTIRFGHALMLKGAASPDWRGPLDVRLAESQAVIATAIAPPTLQP
jgi:hypothetical protein